MEMDEDDEVGIRVWKQKQAFTRMKWKYDPIIPNVSQYIIY
jgi:hypothetical protein